MNHACETAVQRATGFPALFSEGANEDAKLRAHRAAENTVSSSRRRPGPISRRRLLSVWSMTSFHTAVMGPGLRGNDGSSRRFRGLPKNISVEAAKTARGAVVILTCLPTQPISPDQSCLNVYGQSIAPPFTAHSQRVPELIDVVLDTQ